ncbi:MAG: 4Fe-4S dicluster domain-containing protein [Planctomycetes bacterium]|nr:4Fe-4S dicluster domain-containing protein [Planctomycetota bacterium]MCB9905539.1 4Fe-4S dicluster domain-containing protein [Planctomycetota bacterium]
MVDLRPLPLAALLTRLDRELSERGSIFDLPVAKVFTGREQPDVSVRVNGRRASTSLGPAAGPHTQMAQNIALSWLAGGRILELKTVQVLDELEIPRPCIDMQTIGFNVEWSQELKLAQSRDEYVKALMLVRALRERDELEFADGACDTVYDLSVGYDLVGIRGEAVSSFLRDMLDCRRHVDRLRKEIPSAYAALRDLDFPRRVSDTLTLSTFHGCPPDEIERIVEHLQDEHHLHCVVKFNPTLLGRERLESILHERLGYTELHVPESAFEKDTRWDQALGIAQRLSARAAQRGLHFGVKFTNTLIVENHRHFFRRSEREMYLSGQPLHALAMELVRDFRRALGATIPISFSAGIDRKNYHRAAALDLVPTTVCSDWLRPGGYARAKGYLDELATRMRAVGGRDVDDWIFRAYDGFDACIDELGPVAAAAARAAFEAGSSLRDALAPGDYARLRAAAVLHNTDAYVDGLALEDRYSKPSNAKPPKKIGSKLELFDCINCDKCVPVCPNDANFSYRLDASPIPIRSVRLDAKGFHFETLGELQLADAHQLGNFADFCNECGNCDVFCPEDGGPYVLKPRVFGRLADFKAFRDHDGLCFERAGDFETLHARISGVELKWIQSPHGSQYVGPGFDLHFDPRDPESTVHGKLVGQCDWTWVEVLARWHRALFGRDAIDWPAFTGEL